VHRRQIGELQQLQHSSVTICGRGRHYAGSAVAGGGGDKVNGSGYRHAYQLALFVFFDAIQVFRFFDSIDEQNAVQVVDFVVNQNRVKPLKDPVKGFAPNSPPPLFNSSRLSNRSRQHIERASSGDMSELTKFEK